MGLVQDSIVGFRTKMLRDSITRPANTTAYSAGDAISDADDSHLVFGSESKRIGRPGFNTVTLNAVSIHTDANVSPALNCELWIFAADPSTTADNAAFAASDDESMDVVAIVSVAADDWIVGNSGEGEDGNQVAILRNVDQPIRTAGNGLLYGQLVARDAYTPVSGQTFSVNLAVTQD